MICHATGTGKTVTAVLDAKKCGGRVLCVAHTLELVNQSINTFINLWPEATIGKFDSEKKDTNSHIICGTVQSIALNLDQFRDDDFDYLIIDEAHHATAETYKKIISYFKPKFILGLTATPERTDNVDILEIFKQTAHRLDLKQAVEIGALVPVRCIRIHTNIDMTKVRFNSIQYNNRDLDVKISLLGRNQLIVDTWINFVKNKRTVVFCTSVKHAQNIAKLFQAQSISAIAVSGSMKHSERNSILENFKNGKIKILCACDLLNEGWDCPEVEVLFMARPTMSRMLYTQQLGRGMRKCDGKDYLMVFDFVDNFNAFNASYSLHRLLKISDYRAGALVLANERYLKIDENLYRKGEKPDAIIDYPVSAQDYELVNIFNWQEQITGLLSQIDFVRKVDVQEGTVESYIRKGKIVPDFVVPMSENRKFNYFKEANVIKYAKEFGWNIIDNSNKKEIFLEMVDRMDMSYSYKPVFIKAFLKCVDKNGRAELKNIVTEFSNFYEERRVRNVIVERCRSIFAKGNYTEKEALSNILSNPFKRFEDMNLMHHTKNIGVIAIDNVIWKKLTKKDLQKINTICDAKIKEYYNKIN